MVFYFGKESYFEGVLLYGDLITMGATDRYFFYTLIFNSLFYILALVCNMNGMIEDLLMSCLIFIVWKVNC